MATGKTTSAMATTALTGRTMPATRTTVPGKTMVREIANRGRTMRTVPPKITVPKTMLPSRLILLIADTGSSKAARPTAMASAITAREAVRVPRAIADAPAWARATLIAAAAALAAVAAGDGGD